MHSFAAIKLPAWRRGVLHQHDVDSLMAECVDSTQKQLACHPYYLLSEAWYLFSNCMLLWTLILFISLFEIDCLIIRLYSVGIDLKELEGGGVSCRNVWNFAQGLKFKADFHSKMGVCRHELNPPTPDNSNPGFMTVSIQTKPNKPLSLL